MSQFNPAQGEQKWSVRTAGGRALGKGETGDEAEADWGGLGAPS